MIMDFEKIRYWVFVFCGILTAIVVADILSNVFLTFAGLTGIIGFFAGFILYAMLFFGILAVIERVAGIRILGFSGQRD
jgi:hypothetical protein